MIKDSVEKTSIGAVGAISSFKLSDINEVLSLVIALVTITYLLVSISTKLMERRTLKVRLKNGGAE